MVSKKMWPRMFFFPANPGSAARYSRLELKVLA